MVENEQIHQQLREALSNGDVDYVIDVLSNDDVDIDQRDVTHDLQTILMKLCYLNLESSSLVAIIDVIFKKGPDVNIQDSWGRTALMHACIANKPPIIEALFEYEHTDVAVIDFDGNSAMSYAVQNCDIYTLEDILSHKDGPALLNVYNAKSHSPLTIAEKSGNKQVIKLFEPHMNRTAGLADKSHKRRKPRSRDVTKHLPPAYSPSPERKCDNTSNLRQTTPRKFTTRESSNSDKREQYPVSNSAILGKCDSAPVIRLAADDRPTLEPSLTLSSPRLMRRHHKQDCLLTETLLLNQSKKLPYFKTDNQVTDEEIECQNYSLRRQRRPSVSLPDLRNVLGSLVSSGNSTPNTDGGSCSRSNSPVSERCRQNDDDDDVFSTSYPNSLLSSRRSDKNTYRRQFSEQQIILPEISPGAVTLTTPRTKRKGLSSLVKQRKYSSSDDQINRKVVL